MTGASIRVIRARCSPVTGTVNCPADTGGSGLPAGCGTRRSACGIVHRDKMGAVRRPGNPGPRVRGDCRGGRSRGKRSCPSCRPGRPGSRSEVIGVVLQDPQADAALDTQPGAAPDTPVSPGTSRDVAVADGTRLSGRAACCLADEARCTAQAARAGRVANTWRRAGEALDLTPLRELVSELTEELQEGQGPRERIARGLRQAALIIDPPAPARARKTRPALRPGSSPVPGPASSSQPASQRNSFAGVLCATTRPRPFRHMYPASASAMLDWAG